MSLQGLLSHCWPTDNFGLCSLVGRPEKKVDRGKLGWCGLVMERLKRYTQLNQSTTVTVTFVYAHTLDTPYSLRISVQRTKKRKTMREKFGKKSTDLILKGNQAANKLVASIHVDTSPIMPVSSDMPSILLLHKQDKLKQTWSSQCKGRNQSYSTVDSNLRHQITCNLIYTNSRVHRTHPHLHPWCIYCTETQTHIFIDCPAAKDIWNEQWKKSRAQEHRDRQIPPLLPPNHPTIQPPNATHHLLQLNPARNSRQWDTYSWAYCPSLFERPFESFLEVRIVHRPSAAQFKPSTRSRHYWPIIATSTFSSMAAQTPKDLLVSLINAHKPNDGYTTAWVDAAVDKIDAAGDGKVRNWILKIQNSTPGFVADYIALKNSIDAAGESRPFLFSLFSSRCPQGLYGALRASQALARIAAALGVVLAAVTWCIQIHQLQTQIQQQSLAYANSVPDLYDRVRQALGGQD
ncbi:hypothetical protein PROFUN_06805, partial [Planoprotostelium fungivorum]